MSIPVISQLMSRDLPGKWRPSCDYPRMDNPKSGFDWHEYHLSALHHSASDHSLTDLTFKEKPCSEFSDPFCWPPLTIKRLFDLMPLSVRKGNIIPRFLSFSWPCECTRYTTIKMIYLRGWGWCKCVIVIGYNVDRIGWAMWAYMERNFHCYAIIIWVCQSVSLSISLFILFTST